MSQDNPRIAVLSFAIECNRFSPVSTAEDFQTDVDIRGNQIVSEARSGASITLPDLPGFFTEMDRTGNWTPVPLRVSQAQPGGPVEETFFKEFLAEIEAGLQAATAARCGVRRRPRRGPGRGHRRSRRRPVRGHPPRRRAGHPGRLDLRPARQRLAQDDRQPLGVRRLPREPAHRHLRARRRSRQAHARVPGRRAHRGHHGQGAAGAAADLVARPPRAPTPT